MLLTVMFGFAFSKAATSSSHSLCCTGCCAAGGAQLMEIVTWPPGAACPPLDDGLLEQAAAVRTRPAAAMTAATGCLIIGHSLPWAVAVTGNIRWSASDCKISME